MDISLSSSRELQLFIPGPTGSGHHVTIPASVDGLRLLRRILAANEAGERKIAQAGAPTQQQINAAIAKFLTERTAIETKTAETKRNEVADRLAQFGINIDEIKI